MRNFCIAFVEVLGFDVRDPYDLEDFVLVLRNIFLFIAWVIISTSMATFLLKDGSFPPEPQGWIQFRVTLLALLREAF